MFLVEKQSKRQDSNLRMAVPLAYWGIAESPKLDNLFCITAA